VREEERLTRALLLFRPPRHDARVTICEIVPRCRAYGASYFSVSHFRFFRIVGYAPRVTRPAIYKRLRRKPLLYRITSRLSPPESYTTATSSPSPLPACIGRWDSRPPKPRLLWTCTGEERLGFWEALLRDYWRHHVDWRLLPRRGFFPGHQQPLHRRHGWWRQRERESSCSTVCNLFLSISISVTNPCTSVWNRCDLFICVRCDMFIYSASMHD
jgi:hypothetical protein